MAHFLFNVVRASREQAEACLRAGMWGVDVGEPHREALAVGDLALVYLGAPERSFIGRVELASAVREWTPSDAQTYPGDSPCGVLLAEVEEWDPPVPMSTVLSRIGSTTARADFEAGVVQISSSEYEVAVCAAAER